MSFTQAKGQHYTQGERLAKDQGGGRSYTSVWRATQARDAVTGVAVASVHGAELAELVA